MLPEDTYRKQRNSFIAGLEAWAREMADCAEISHGPVGDAWRISAEPAAATACPFEFVLRADQKCDAQIGGQMYEDLSFDNLDLPRIVQAISDGRVTIRHWESTVTGLAYSIETVIDLGGGDRWHVQSMISKTWPTEDEELMARLVAFAPYRR